MPQLSLSQFRVAANGLDGKVLATHAQGKQFRFRILPTGLEYTPSATDRPRRQDWKHVAAVLDRFNKTGSFEPGQYQDVTYNASYVLAVLRAVVSGA
jgi:hypothetical protein